MLKAREIIGLPVISIKTGKRLGTAKDVLLNAQWELTGILLNPGRMFFPPQIIEQKNLIAIGEDAITVPGKEAMRRLDRNSPLFSLRFGKKIITGMPVMTRSGMQLGRLEDVYLEDPSVNKINGLELTDGFISDLMEGRKCFPLDGEAAIGEETILVDR